MLGFRFAPTHPTLCYTIEEIASAGWVERSETHPTCLSFLPFRKITDFYLWETMSERKVRPTLRTRPKGLYKRCLGHIILHLLSLHIMPFF